MKNFKEKKLLVKWAQAMGEPVDKELLEEVQRYEQLQKEIQESVRKNSISDLSEASKVAEEFVNKVTQYPKPPTLDEVLNVLKEEVDELVQAQEITTQAKSQPTSLAERAAEFITKEAKLEEKADSFQQPNPALVEKNIEAVQKKLKFLEQAIGKIAAHGPGGGAGDVINLDHPVKLITNNYTVTRRDYYIGVNSSSTITIILPDSIGFPGRMVIIKDESGNCESNPILVSGTVDNDPGGFILAQNNGGIQMIYREGWRIV